MGGKIGERSEVAVKKVFEEEEVDEEDFFLMMLGRGITLGKE